MGFWYYDVKNQLPFTDESYILILNTSCDADKVPKHLKALYAYISDPEKTEGDSLMQKINDKVEKYNGSEWRWMQVTFEEHVKHVAYLAKEEGLEAGRKEGLQDGEAKASRKIAAKLKLSGLPAEEIAEAAGLAIEEVEVL